MFYTVIQKSGWQDAGWMVADTFNAIGDAEKFASENRQSTDPREYFYNVRVMLHRKPIEKLANDDHSCVTFADGTSATPIW